MDPTWASHRSHRWCHRPRLRCARGLDTHQSDRIESHKRGTTRDQNARRTEHPCLSDMRPAPRPVATESNCLRAGCPPKLEEKVGDSGKFGRSYWSAPTLTTSSTTPRPEQTCSRRFYAEIRFGPTSGCSALVARIRMLTKTN